MMRFIQILIKALEIAGSVFDTEYEKQLVNYGGDTYSILYHT